MRNPLNLVRTHAEEKLLGSDVSRRSWHRDITTIGRGGSWGMGQCPDDKQRYALCFASDFEDLCLLSCHDYVDMCPPRPAWTAWTAWTAQAMTIVCSRNLSQYGHPRNQA